MLETLDIEYRISKPGLTKNQTKCCSMSQFAAKIVVCIIWLSLWLLLAAVWPFDCEVKGAV